MTILYITENGRGSCWIGSDYTANFFPLLDPTDSIWLVPGTF